MLAFLANAPLYVAAVPGGHHLRRDDPRARPLPGGAGLRRRGRPVLHRLRQGHRRWRDKSGRRVADRLAAARRLCAASPATRTPPACRTRTTWSAARARSSRAKGRRRREALLPFKPLWQRALVVAAGPAANFVLVDRALRRPVRWRSASRSPRGAIAGVVPGSAGRARRLPGRRRDRRGRRPPARRASSDLQPYVVYRARRADRLRGAARGGQLIDLHGDAARQQRSTDALGGQQTVGLLGVSRAARPARSVCATARSPRSAWASQRTWRRRRDHRLLHRPHGHRRRESADQLHGPIGMATLSGTLAKAGDQRRARRSGAAGAGHAGQPDQPLRR